MIPKNLKQLIRDVLMAYAETVLIPVRGEWGDATSTACALTVLGRSRGELVGDYPNDEAFAMEAGLQSGMDHDESEAFYAGFDEFDYGGYKHRRPDKEHPHHYRAGQVCARLVFRKALVEVVPNQEISHVRED